MQYTTRVRQRGDHAADAGARAAGDSAEPCVAVSPPPMHGADALCALCITCVSCAATKWCRMRAQNDRQVAVRMPAVRQARAAQASAAQGTPSRFITSSIALFFIHSLSHFMNLYMCRRRAARCTACQRSVGDAKQPARATCWQ